ncbi:SIS domain-containing protein [Clostridium sp. Marseille-P2415]|uniref:MurR/RpiR family transcriptional regulator n=1 Tax=Clostridium sp. Marseille-P2415 TaxID=1805471 RepID=UPI0011156743
MYYRTVFKSNRGYLIYGFLITSAVTSVISGFQASQCLADYCQYTLSKIRGQVYQFHEWNRDAHTLVTSTIGSCAAIVAALSRYPNTTIEFIKRFSAKGISIIPITDSLTFPCSELADLVFVIPVAYYSYVNSFSAVFCLINCLMLEVIRQNLEKARTEMEAFETYVSENHIYYMNQNKKSVIVNDL